MYKVLKLGLLIDKSNTIPNWLFHTLQRLQSDGYAHVGILIHSTQSIKVQNSPLFNLYQKMDKKLFGSAEDANSPKEYSSLYIDTPYIDISNVEEIKKHDLDIIVNVSNLQKSTQLNAYAKYGIWSFEGVECMRFFDEILKDHKLLQSSLIMEDKKGKTLLCTASSQILSYSLIRDENEHLWTLAALLPRELKKLSKLESLQYFEQKSPSSDIDTLSTPCMLTALLKQSYRVIKKIIEKRFFKEQWFLMYKNKEELTDIKLDTYKSIIPTVEHFWADPFVVDVEDKRYIFIEEEPLNSHGHISLMTMEKDGSISKPKPIIKKPYHMSYPFVFVHQERYFMIPETSENRTIELYEAVDFPHRWEFKQNLMSDIHAVDTTLFYKDGTWWLFTSVTEFKGGWDNGSLSLFFSDDLFGANWNEHPYNPISIDPSHARMAGCVFEKDSKIYRPSQNCSTRYGYGFNLEEITTLSTTEYKEKTITQVIPDEKKTILGVHTINFADNFTMIDAVHMRSKFK